MVHVETVDLSPLGISFPSDAVGIVAAQPYVELSAAEPYRCRESARAKQLQMIRDTLEVSRAASHGAAKTHFTLFPEYSIPGLQGIALVQAEMSLPTWPNGTVIIGGTDALLKEEFATLAAEDRTFFDITSNGLAGIAENAWINCCVIWVKDQAGIVSRWLQPKLEPAWPEQNVSYQDMYHGNSAYVFKGVLENGVPFRFCTLVCFDWIGSRAQKKLWEWVLSEVDLQAAAAGGLLPLSWFFVIQCNKKPSHYAFLNEVIRFFDGTQIPRVQRDRTCLIFANSAGMASPGRADNYGNSALIFSPSALFGKPNCRPTFSSGGEPYRSSQILDGYSDYVFREKGACVHSFLQVNPASVPFGAASKTIAIQSPWVYPLYGNADPRSPGGSVPACVKWVNDKLDDIPSLGARYGQTALAGACQTAHLELVDSLRTASPQSLSTSIELAQAEFEGADVDSWGDSQHDAFMHVVDTLVILAVAGGNPKFTGGDSHATVTIGGRAVDVQAVLGATHEACADHSKSRTRSARRPVLVVSRDRDNNRWLARTGSFLERHQRLDEEPRITEPAAVMHLGFRQLLDIFQQAANEATAGNALNDALTA